MFQKYIYKYATQTLRFGPVTQVEHVAIEIVVGNKNRQSQTRLPRTRPNTAPVRRVRGIRRRRKKKKTVRQKLIALFNTPNGSGYSSDTRNVS